MTGLSAKLCIVTSIARCIASMHALVQGGDCVAVQVAMVQAVDGGDVTSMLQMAGALERSSAHPVAAAIVGHAAGSGLDLGLDVLHSQEIAGKVTVEIPFC